MSEEISLQALIDKVKADLLTPPGDPKNVLFFVDKVELELAVSITEEKGAGIKISLLNLFSGDVTGKDTGARGHTIKVTLAPILSLEEQRALLNQNPQLKQMVERASLNAMWKSGEGQLAGKPE